MSLNDIQRQLLREIADLETVPKGAYNIRANGESAGRSTTANIDIVTKTDKPGIDIIIKPGTKNESVHIPVVLSQSGLTEVVYNKVGLFGISQRYRCLGPYLGVILIAEQLLARRTEKGGG